MPRLQDPNRRSYGIPTISRSMKRSSDSTTNAGPACLARKNRAWRPLYFSSEAIASIRARISSPLLMSSGLSASSDNSSGTSMM